MSLGAQLNNIWPQSDLARGELGSGSPKIAYIPESKPPHIDQLERVAKVFAGSDGHGVCMGVISCENLESEGYAARLYSEWPRTGSPSHFWGKTFLEEDFKDLSLIVVVDIPLPQPDGTFPNALPDALNRIKELNASGTRIVIIDHHKSTATYYDAARSAGAEIIITSTANSCYYGQPNDIYKDIARLGAISDRDSAVLPVSPKEIEESLGLDAAVRSNIPEVVSALRAGDLEYFSRLGAVVPPPPGEISFDDKIVTVSSLTPTWGFKQLGQLCDKTGADYALGVDNFNGFWRVIAITNWQSAGLPVALKLGLTNFIGHGAAIIEIIVPAADPHGEQKALERVMDLKAALKDPSRTIGQHGITNSRADIFNCISQFMREAEIPFFLTQHGWPHIERVIANGRSLGSAVGLDPKKQRLLDWSCLMHDVGNGAGPIYNVSDKEARKRHHEFSRKMVLEWGNRGLFGTVLTTEEYEKVAELCYSHRKSVPLPSDPTQRLLTCLLRVADALDIDSRRGQRNDNGKWFEELDLDEESIKHWEGHRAIEAVRIALSSHGEVLFEVIVNDPEKGQFQVAQLAQEIGCLEEYYPCNLVMVDMHSKEQINMPLQKPEL